jgi:hypothetical protein
MQVQSCRCVVRAIDPDYLLAPRWYARAQPSPGCALTEQHIAPAIMSAAGYRGPIHEEPEAGILHVRICGG